MKIIGFILYYLIQGYNLLMMGVSYVAAFIFDDIAFGKNIFNIELEPFRTICFLFMFFSYGYFVYAINKYFYPLIKDQKWKECLIVIL